LYEIYNLKKHLFIFLILCSLSVFSQQKKINILHADNIFIDEEAHPGATILLGNVRISHEGVLLNCNKAIQYKKNNFIKALGNVILNQGDTIIEKSNYTEYNGNTKQAVSFGNVSIKDTKMTLTTDTLHFNRAKQLLYYNDGATIKDSANVLTSKVGFYYLQNKKFQANDKVILTNKEYVLNTNHLDYYTNSGEAFFYGPSTITGKKNSIYSQKGYYNTSTDISYFKKNAEIDYKDRIIKGDSLYYNRNTGFASATGNISIKDSINNFIAKGGYAEFFEQKDSAFVVKKALAISIFKKDSLFIHGDTLMVTGKPKQRIINVFHNVKFFKSDLSGKCDSIITNQKTGITKLIKNPVVWSNKSQITGDEIRLLNNLTTNKLDSLKVLNNAFVIQKDSLGYNQIKGRNIYGKFIDNDLKKVHVIGNGEVVFYVYNEAKQFVGINKSTCSNIDFLLKDGEIETIKFITEPDGKTYPPSKLPKNVRKLRGFIWRENERPLKKEDIFIP